MSTADGENQFDWVELKKDLDKAYGARETFKEKFNRKFYDNPLVPIGCVATAACLTYGLISFRKGDAKRSQLMMRLRVAAQGFTVVALIGGIYATAMKREKTTS